MRRSRLPEPRPLLPEEKISKFRYNGTSMLPTFKPGQVLYIQPEWHSPQPGDIVVYYNEGDFIVHRVKTVGIDSIITRGDNNSLVDETPVPMDQIIGVVEKIDDWGTPHSVSGGRKALRQARVRWGLRRVFNKMLPWVGAPYRWLKARRWVPKIWQPHISIIQLQTPAGVMVKYVVRGKTVATWQPAQVRFIYRRPYDLVIFPPDIPR